MWTITVWLDGRRDEVDNPITTTVTAMLDHTHNPEVAETKAHDAMTCLLRSSVKATAVSGGDVRLEHKYILLGCSLCKVLGLVQRPSLWELAWGREQ